MQNSKTLYSKFYLQNKSKQLCFSDASTAYLQFKNYRINLLTGKKEQFSYHSFLDDLKKIDFSYKKFPYVIHLFFELGYIFNDLSELVAEDSELGIYIKYEKVKEEQICESKSSAPIKIEKKSYRFLREEYNKKFKKVYEHLLKGDCYQLNLTFNTSFKVKKIDLSKVFNYLWSKRDEVGAYAHATYSEALSQLLLSNSPECLYQIYKNKIRTMPIKGTLKRTGDIEKAWEKLTQSNKNESELNMITDLMRNDLTKIQNMPSKVVSKKRPLIVPGLIHQYSVIESPIKSSELSLFDVLKSLFPGGSITGAPKKSVLKLTKEIERSIRGNYCGSTVLIYKNINTASINIRSSKIDLKNNTLNYGTGGGITLSSDVKDEFNEALAKLKSFLSFIS